MVTYNYILNGELLYQPKIWFTTFKIITQKDTTIQSHTISWQQCNYSEVINQFTGSSALRVWWSAKKKKKKNQANAHNDSSLYELSLCMLNDLKLYEILLQMLVTWESIKKSKHISSMPTLLRKAESITNNPGLVQRTGALRPGF